MIGKAFFRLFKEIERHSTIAISSAVFALGVAVGFYAYGVHQRNLEVLIPAALVLAFLTYIGSATDILGLLREWYKDKKEQQRREEEQIANLPKLSVEYDERNIDQYCPTLADPRIKKYGFVFRKYLRIRVANEGGTAYDVEAKLEVIKDQGTNPTTEEKYLQWVKDNVPSLNIRHNKDAFLNIVFSIERREEDYIAFAGTKQSLNGPLTPRSIDGIKVGKYDLKVTIIPENSDLIVLNLLLDVKENWQDLSMQIQKIS